MQDGESGLEADGVGDFRAGENVTKGSEGLIREGLDLGLDLGGVAGAGVGEFTGEVLVFLGPEVDGGAVDAGIGGGGGDG